VKRIGPLKGINTPAFIVHIHWRWITFDAHPKCKSVNSPLLVLLFQRRNISKLQLCMRQQTENCTVW
jgi:hypothetical protein